MNHPLIQPLIESVCNVLSMMTQTPCSTASDGPGPQDIPRERVVGCVSISGDVQAHVRLIFPSETGDALVRRMTGLSEVSAQGVDDALGELCNMIVGSAKSSLSLEHTSLSCPTVLRETGVDDTPADAQTTTTRFKSEAGPFTMVLLQAA
ncbi:MAG: chemotaxis protein CheX [Phycisphaerales bacterium JB063]